MASDNLLLCVMFAFGSLAGLASRWALPSPWAALAFPLVFPPLAIGCSVSFC
jgi:hypothetical protein